MAAAPHCHTAWVQFPREEPTAAQLQQWCDQYLDAPQWTQLQAVIRTSRRDTRQTHTVRLSTSAHALLHNLATREQLVVYLCAAGNADGPVRSRSRRVNQPALTSQIRVSEPDVTLFNCLRAHMGRSTPRSSPSSATYTLCGCGHGGTRNSSTSRNVQT